MSNVAKARFKSTAGKLVGIICRPQLVGLSLALLFIGCRASITWQVCVQEDYQRQYDRAYKLYEKKRYYEAIQAFSDLLNKSCQHQLSDNAQYWIGESYYALRDYKQAICAFEKVFQFEQSNKNDAALLKLGLCYANKKNYQEACCYFKQLMDDYPQSKYRERSECYYQKYGKQPCS